MTVSEPAAESAPSVPVILLQQAIGALQTTSVAVAEVKAEVVASRDASARAHETHGRRLDDFSGVVASVAAAQVASTAVNARLATTARLAWATILDDDRPAAAAGSLFAALVAAASETATKPASR